MSPLNEVSQEIALTVTNIITWELYSPAAFVLILVVI